MNLLISFTIYYNYNNKTDAATTSEVDMSHDDFVTHTYKDNLTFSLRYYTRNAANYNDSVDYDINYFKLLTTNSIIMLISVLIKLSLGFTECRLY